MTNKDRLQEGPREARTVTGGTKRKKSSKKGIPVITGQIGPSDLSHAMLEKDRNVNMAVKRKRFLIARAGQAQDRGLNRGFSAQSRWEEKTQGSRDASKKSTE